MLKSSIKLIGVAFNLFFIFCIKIDAQSSYAFKGNIKIKSTCLLKAMDGFYKYIVNKKDNNFNASEYYVRLNLSSTDDSCDYVEISLYNYSVTNLEKNPNQFYGYLKKGNIYFVFSTDNRLIAKKKTGNPRLFKNIKNSKHYPKPTYDPYRWEFVICRNKIAKKSPSDIIENYVPD